jgi:hypothetical protein
MQCVMHRPQLKQLSFRMISNFPIFVEVNFTGDVSMRYLSYILCTFVVIIGSDPEGVQKFSISRIGFHGLDEGIDLLFRTTEFFLYG